jgi:hypothetical protein
MCCFVGGCGEGFFMCEKLISWSTRENGVEVEEITSVWM